MIKRAKEDLSSEPAFQNYLGDFRCYGDSEEVHGHVHASHHENEQAVARVAVGAQALLNEGKQKMFSKLASHSFLIDPRRYSPELQLCL